MFKDQTKIVRNNNCKMSFPSLLFVKHHSSVGKTWWCIPDNSPIKRYNIVSREFFPLDERLSILGFPLSAWCRGIAALCWSSGSVVRSVYRPLVSSVHEHPSYCGNDCSYEPEEPSLGEIFAKSCKKRRRRDGKSNSHWTAFKLIFFFFSTQHSKVLLSARMMTRTESMNQNTL